MDLGRNILEVDDVSLRFGGVQALKHVSLSVAEGEIRGLIGPNGAGKTSLFNVIAGVLRPDSGSVLFRGERISGLPCHAIAKKGVVRTFQLTAVFPEMSVRDNLVIGAHLRQPPRFWTEVVNSGGARRGTKRVESVARELLESLGMENVADERAGRLPYGYRRLLSVGIAIAAGPKLVLMDEPVAGLSHADIERMLGHIARLREGGISVLIVEHNVSAVLRSCDRIAVLNFGEKIADGSGGEITSDASVIAAYLGSSADSGRGDDGGGDDSQRQDGNEGRVQT